MLFTIEQGNVTDFPADVLALKYARAFHGADDAVARILSRSGLDDNGMMPEVSEARMVATRGAIRSRHVLFVGVPKISAFRYRQIREFAARVVREVGRQTPDACHLALTLHGVGYGLDEIESLQSEVSGLVDALGSAPNLERISLVERRPERVSRLRVALEDMLANAPYAVRDGTGFRLKAQDVPSKREPSVTKPHVFVAMPFVDEKEDVFWYGIQNPVHRFGFNCERIDMNTFMGDIVDQIKQRIDVAALVIADLSGANANVYLEVGYAWGRGRPTLLLVDDIDTLRFDVKGQRCIAYRSIKQLETKLYAELESLRARGVL